jgi:hypothetical protein
MDTVIRPMCPRWLERKASAAAACVVVGYVTTCDVWGRTSGHPTVASRDVVVAPPHPKLTRVRCVFRATYAVYPGVAPSRGWYPTEYESPRDT